MSFVLPGNARQLRFTGEAKAFTGDDTGAPVALGKPRVRKATTTPPPAPIPTPSMTPAPMATSRPRNTTGPQSMTPASPGNSHRLNTPVPQYTGASPSIRAKRGDVDEEMQTMALDRECHDVLPDGLSGQGGLSPTRRPPPSASARGPAPAPAPIPHFRPANGGAQVQMQTVLAPNADGSKPKGAPLALWLFAAVLAGILSYHVTPAIMSHFEPPPAAKITPAI
ncbi:MAG: hypothetical protein KIT84_23880 [Labilithrix sp.]|nr:hypothetical protein [Labilithrix sp.]MCW5814089.1 hypothetical protein [Labilithrix sp.]